MKYIATLLLLLISFSSCQKYGLEVRRQRVDQTYLASTHVGSPDPRQECPPCGQMVVIEWWVPRELLCQNPKICLHLVLWDYTQRTVVFPIDKRIGYETYFVIGKDFESTCGIITYKAEIITEDGCVFRDWKHQLWVDLIQIEEESNEEEQASSIESSSSSVSSQSMQGSVMETPSSKKVVKAVKG